MLPTDEDRGSEEPQIAADADRMRLIDQCVTDFAIITFDTEGRIHTWNVGAERILGYTAEQAIGQPASIILTPEDRQQGVEEQAMQLAVRTGHAENERWHVRQDGSRFFGNCVVTALREENGTLRGYLKILRDLTAHNAAEAQVRALQEQQAILHERSRMAQELHDTLAQGLAGITMQLVLADNRMDETPQAARAHLYRARDIANESLAEARRAVQALRPTALQTADLSSALHTLTTCMSADNRIPVQWKQQGTPRPLLPDVENHLYRIAQEALTNALKYAHATEVVVALTFAPDQVQLCVNDDGAGFDMQAPPQGGGFGLKGMRERAEQMGGQWHLTCDAGQGTQIEVVVPVT